MELTWECKDKHNINTGFGHKFDASKKPLWKHEMYDLDRLRSFAAHF